MTSVFNITRECPSSIQRTRVQTMLIVSEQERLWPGVQDFCRPARRVNWYNYAFDAGSCFTGASFNNDVISRSSDSCCRVSEASVYGYVSSILYCVGAPAQLIRQADFLSYTSPTRFYGCYAVSFHRSPSNKPFLAWQSPVYGWLPLVGSLAKG